MRIITTLATVAALVITIQAQEIFDIDDYDLPFPIIIEPREHHYYGDPIAPVVILHGIDSDCNDIHAWITDIAIEISNRAIVKCVEIGDGKVTSIFERMKWQVNTVCHKLHNDPDFADKEISIVGIS